VREASEARLLAVVSDTGCRVEYAAPLDEDSVIIHEYEAALKSGVVDRETGTRFNYTK